MIHLNKKKLFLSITSLFLLTAVLVIIYALFKFRTSINMQSLLWLFGLMLAVFLLAVGILFMYDARNCGRKRKDVRFG